MKRIFMNMSRFLHNRKIVSFMGLSFFILLISIVAFIPKSFALPIANISLTSSKSNYVKSENGAWKITKSAEWLEKGKAEITVSVDTVLMPKTKATDVLLVYDVSDSMSGTKLDNLKNSTIKLLDSLLENGNSRVGLITFGTESSISLGLTNDKNRLVNAVNSMVVSGNTNYYQALVNVDNVLKNYNKDSNRDFVVLFLTDGCPNIEILNEVFQYEYLKDRYPFININAIQYEMGEKIYSQVEKISDRQFVTNIEKLDNALLEASMFSDSYSSFQVTDYIDGNYFTISEANGINVSTGKVSVDQTTQKITWRLDGLMTGNKATMKFEVQLKNEFIDKTGTYFVLKQEDIYSKLGGVEENVSAQNTLSLINRY